MKVEAISEALGARITGIDLSENLDDNTFKAIHRAWLDYQVLVFPGQQLNEESQVKFSAWFGELGVRHRKETPAEEGRVNHPGTMLISNIREDNKPIGSLPDGELMYHSDGAFAKRPFRYTLLFAIEVPSVGGNTKYANMYKAYDNLEADLKSTLAGCHAEQRYYANNDFNIKTRSLSGNRQHPVFIEHEETGRTALYVSRLMTTKIIGLPEDESDGILERLFNHAERSEVVYEHVWTPGDFVIWDNRCLNHARTDFSEGERRLLRRTAVFGVDPVAATAQAS